MNLVADEGIDRQIVDRLRADHHIVRYVADLAPGLSDEAVFALANENGALLLTADKDFGEIVFRRHRVHHGVVLLRLAGISPARKAAITSAALARHEGELDGAFVVISPGTIRIRARSLG